MDGNFVLNLRIDAVTFIVRELVAFWSLRHATSQEQPFSNKRGIIALK
jgi:hypothetical protein